MEPQIRGATGKKSYLHQFLKPRARACSKQTIMITEGRWTLLLLKDKVPTKMSLYSTK